MSQKLTIIARIEAKKESLDKVKKEVQNLVAPTLKEEGCLQYELYQDNEKPELFIFTERWESKSLWDQHMQSTHLKNFISRTEGLLVDLVVHQMKKI